MEKARKQDILFFYFSLSVFYHIKEIFFHLPKLKDFADNNFRFDENDRKFLKSVENSVGKGEIARYEQFLLFQQCFQKNFTADT